MATILLQEYQLKKRFTLLEIPAKITSARITPQDHNIDIIKHNIENIKKEINEIENGSDFEHITVLIKEAFDHIRKDERPEAHKKYQEIMRLYKLLTKTLKKTVLSACIELHKRLQ